MIYDNKLAVDYIKDGVKEFKKNRKMTLNAPVREDIFTIVERESILLYYPLEDNSIKGCHIRKVLNGKLEHFVFINTLKNVQEQTWTAAHELGHICGIDKEVNEKLGDRAINPEDIVNRFASEFLFPENCFESERRKGFVYLGVENGVLSVEQYMYIVTYLMDYFCAPYKAIIRRFVELGSVVKENERRYIEAFENHISYYEQLLEENYFTHLNKKHNACNIEHIGNDIKELEEIGLLSDEKIKKYREMFMLKEETITGETFEIGGLNAKKQTKGRN